MPIPYHLQIAIWKEVSRHERIASVIDRAGRLLHEAMPLLRRITIRRFNREALELRTVGEIFFDARSAAPHPWINTAAKIGKNDAQLLERFLTADLSLWILKTERLEPGLLAALPDHARSPLWVAPLKTRDTHPGVLTLEFDGDSDDSEQERDTGFSTLREPFTVALENDWRLETLETLSLAVEGENQRLLRRLGRHMPETQEEIIGEQGGLSQVFQHVGLIAGRDVSVLLLGETGAGKEVVARALHERSPRHSGPFIRVNCGALAPELVDSELFGHEKGSFTGAIAQRRGWFEQAHHGTLFLDEVGELSPAAQVRLLRVLQEGVLTRIGGEAPQQVDVRVIAATHRDLAGMAAKGEFREDLWYRLSPFPIFVPPLRDRLEDLEALTQYFARRAAVRFGVHACAPRREDLVLLAAYSWPGNVRELQSVIDRAVLLGQGERLAVEPALGNFAAMPAAGNLPAGANPAGAGAEFRTLDEAQMLHIELALQLCCGRLDGPKGAARLLKIHPNTLRARMKKLGVRWQKFRALQG